MNFRVSIIVAALASAWTMSVAQAGDYKIGFINPIKVMEQAPQAKNAQNKLETEFDPRKKKLDALREKIQKSEEKFKRDAAIMSESERRRMERDLMSDKRDFESEGQAFREDVNIRQGELMREIQQTVLKTVAEIAKSEGYDLIVSEGVVYASDRIDITDLILGKLKSMK